MKTVQELYGGEIPKRRRIADFYATPTEGQEPEQPEQSSGIGDMLLDGLKYSTGLVGSLFPDGFLGYAGGTLAETFGNGLQAMGDPDRTLAARYNPALASVLRSIGGTAQDIADSALEYGASQVKPRNNDEYLGSLRNQLGSGFYGVMQGDASMVKADKSVSAMEEAIRRLADENAIAPSLSWEYILSPHGLTRSFGNMAGSMGAILPSMALAPESAFLTPANAITRFLINRGAYGLAKRTAGNLPNYLRYAATSAPAEALSEGGHVRTENLAQGVSDEEATRRGWNTAAANLPILLGSNLVEAGLFGTPFSQGSALSKLAQAGLRTGGNALQQGTEEALQKAASNAQTGKEYGLTPFGWTPDQWQDFAEGFAGTLPMGVVGSGAHAISDFRRPAETDKERAAREAYEQGSDERISVGDFSTRAEKQSRNLQSSRGIDSFMRAIGGQESGGNYDAVNPDSGASGAFQIMPANWSAWAQDAGLSPDAPMTPENQELVARNKMLEYYNKFGNWRDVAIAWYAGEGEVTNPSYDHDAPQGEYPSVNSYADSVMSRFRKVGGEETEGITYLGNNGKGEGRYWVRQGDYVSFDGAQPDLLNAVDILGKMFYDRTGKQLVITAGTNGDHAGGEHSHGAGWKVDIVDAGANGVGMNEDGALFTADYKAQPFLKEFIEFGRSLGLGMNLEAEGTPNVHIDVALDGHQWDGNGEDAGGFSLDRLRRRGRGIAPSQQDTSSPPPQEETPKPLFDLNAEDEQTQKLLERFASERVQSLANAENPDGNELRFFTGLFNEANEFQNTEANRAALRERYGNEITSWANENLKQESPAQPAAPARTQSSTPRQGAPKVANEDILAATDNFLERLRTDRTNQNTLLELQEARRAGDVAKMESILQQNNAEITPVESTAPDTPSPQPPVQSENVVQNNQPPENILTSEQETAQPQQETKTATPKTQSAQTRTELAHINRVSKATNLANKNEKALDNIVNSIQWLAAQNNIVIPAKDLTKLKKRNPKTISEWRDRLTEAGALTVKPAQETTTAPPAPQQTTQSPAAETTATPKETPLQAALRRGRELLDTQRQQEEQARRQQEEQALRERQEAAEAEVRRKAEENYNRIVQEKAERERQEAQQREDERNADIRAKYYDNQSTAPEANEADLRIARAPISTESRAARAEQGRALLRIFYSEPFRDVQLPAGLEQSLERGDTKAIETAQGLLEQRELADRRRSDTRAGQADEQALIAQEEDIARRAAQSQRATDTAQHGLMQSTAEREQNQRKPEPREEAREETQENVTRQEQPAQEDSRDVFDLPPESNELNDVESTESTEQRPPRETPQTAPQTEEPTQIAPPKPKARRSNREKLYEKYKVDTHPHVKAKLDKLMRDASSKEDSDARQYALRLLKSYEETPIDDEELDAMEAGLVEEENEKRVEEEKKRKKEVLKRANEKAAKGERQTDEEVAVLSEDVVQRRKREYTQSAQEQETAPLLEYNSETSGNIQVVNGKLFPINRQLPKEQEKTLADLAEKHGGRKVPREVAFNIGGSAYGYRFSNPTDGRAFAEEAISSGALDDVTRQAPATDNTHQTKAEPQPQQSKPKQKRSTSKKEEIKDKLYQKFKVDTHPHIKEWIDNLFKRAASRKDTEDRRAAVEELKNYNSLYTPSSRKLNELEIKAFLANWYKDNGGDMYTPVSYIAHQGIHSSYLDRKINFKEALRLLKELKRLEPELKAEFDEYAKKHGEKEAEKTLWEKQMERVEKQLWGEEEPAKTEQPESAKKNDTDETPATEEKPAQDSKPQETETSKPAEKETNEQQAIEELKAKTKAELEEILEADKYPSTKKNLDDVFKDTEYESLEAAQKKLEQVLEQARKWRAENRIANFAAERLYEQWKSSRPHNMSGLTERTDQEVDNKAFKVIHKMRNGEITGEKALEKLDEILSGRAQEKLDAQRAKIRQEKGRVVQETKAQLSEILDLDNHPVLKEYIFKALDQEANRSPVNSNKKLKEWCDNLIAQAKGIRDKGKIEEWEERAKERLPKPQPKPQPDTQKTAPASETPNPQEQEAKQEPVTEKKKETQSEREPIAQEIIYFGYTRAGSGVYRAIDSQGSGKTISKTEAGKHIQQGYAVMLEDATDEAIHHIGLHRILHDWRAIQHAKGESTSNPKAEAILKQYGNDELTAQEAYKKMAELLGVKKQADHILPDNVKKFLESNKGKADITGAPNIDTSNVAAEKDLTPAQKLLVSFGKKLGVEVVFFNNPDGRFRGVHKGGKTFLNINGNKELGGVFWHETFHWLKNNNPELYKALVKAAGITDAQRRAYLETSKRTDLKSNEEIDEEILADMMDDVAKRTGLLQSIAGKNRGLIERAIQWFKDTLNKFIDHFRNPQGKLTTAQAQALADEFGRIANHLKDPNGNQIFRYNRRTHNVELADNRERTEAELAEMTAKNEQFEAKYSVDSNDNSTKSFKQRLKNLLGVEGKNIPIHKQMKLQLEDLSDMKIAADHLPEGVQVKIDEIAKVIRTGREYDWANILPEVGNAVAKQLGITQSAEMGNYIGKFILNGAPNDESAEAKEFAKAMRENTEMRNKVMAIRGTFDKWNNMSAEEQMIASTRYDKEIPPLRERAQKFWQYLRTELFDTQMPIHYHVAKFAKATGIKLSESINPEIAFRNLRGMQQRAMRMVYGNEYTKEALQKMYPNVDFSDWKPMAVILESIKAEPGSQRYMLFDQFVKACHFLDIHRHNDNVLMQQNKARDEISKLRDELAKADTKKKKAELERSIKKKEESLEALKQKIMDTPDAYTYDKCADLVSKYSDEFGEAQKDLVRYSRALLDIWVDSGMMDRRRYHQMLAAYPNYVPLHREFDENPNLNTADSMKQMLGSTKDVKDAIAAIANNTFDYIQRTEKNKAKLLLANLANFDGVGGIFELVDGSSPNDGTIIHFYENGKRKALQCSDEDIVKAVNSMNQPTMNLFLKVLQVPALMLRATATGLSPGFIAGNFLRDPQDAFMVSKRYGAKSIKELPMDFITNPFITWKYITDAISMSPLYEEYAVSGAAQSDFFSFDRDYKAEAIERLTKKNYKRFASPKGVIELLGKLGEWSELTTRLRIYDKVKQSRAKEHGGINIYDDLVTAAFESRDFIDFARHGNAGRTWNTLTAFANPVLQGFDKQWRTYDLGQLKVFGGTEETQKNFRISVARLFLGGILPALVLSLLHKDEDWYKDDVQDWEKENYWILNEYLRVSKGADVGLRFFSNLTEHLISSDPVRADKVLQPLKGILPDLMPTAFLPIFECMANYDLFRRQPIVPQREVNKYKDTPELQYDSTNSKLAVLLGRVTGVSPRYIDHVIYGYTSGFGKEATHLIDTVTPGRHTAWTRSDVPFFSRVLRTPYRAPKIVSEYYEEFGRQESYAQRLAWEKKHGNPNAKPSAEYDPALHRRLKNIQRAMQNLNAAERAIMDDPKLTSEQVEDKREEIQKKRVELCRKAFQRAR